MPYFIADCLAGEKGSQGNPVMKGPLLTSVHRQDVISVMHVALA